MPPSVHLEQILTLPSSEVDMDKEENYFEKERVNISWYFFLDLVLGLLSLCSEVVFLF